MNSALTSLPSSSFRLTTSPFASAPKTLTFPSPSSKVNAVVPPKLRDFSSTGQKSIRACSSSVPEARPPSSSPKNPIRRAIENSAAAAVLLAAAISFAGKLPAARAEPPPPAALSEQQAREEDEGASKSSALPEFLEANPDSIETLKQLLQTKLENREDEEALALLKRLVAAQPAEIEWKFLLARLHNEMGDTQAARQVFEEILQMNPLSFEALFENALLMDRCGEGEAVLSRLEEALKVAEGENRAKEARDVRLIMAQMRFLQKDVEGALRSYQDLVKEDPTDFRPYFCQGMVYSLLDRNEEAREQFAKYRELSPRKFEVEGYLRTPLSRMKLFGTDESN
ncbi:hypothetical protein CDL15_Pgr028865 [Punica granatum]|uniref:Uncharacterized protein n=1 Tax=Punica granatum TaxID=22663 RepID=A0A218WXD2_PUNGR|nr:hypothetical protein CDL15_Pgr028865 [Punica granatum]